MAGALYRASTVPLKTIINATVMTVVQIMAFEVPVRHVVYCADRTSISTAIGMQ